MRVANRNLDLGRDKKKVAEDLLKEREGDVVKGMPITAKVGKIHFEEAVDDLLNDYRTNGKRLPSLPDDRREQRLHVGSAPDVRDRELSRANPTISSRSKVARYTCGHRGVVNTWPILDTESNRRHRTCAAASSREVPCPDCRSGCRAPSRREGAARESGA